MQLERRVHTNAYGYVPINAHASLFPAGCLMQFQKGGGKRRMFMVQYAHTHRHLNTGTEASCDHELKLVVKYGPLSIDPLKNDCIIKHPLSDNYVTYCSSNACTIKTLKFHFITFYSLLLIARSWRETER